MTTANSGLTIAKLIRCAAMLNANHAPEPYIDPYEIMRQMAGRSGIPATANARLTLAKLNSCFALFIANPPPKVAYEIWNDGVKKWLRRSLRARIGWVRRKSKGRMTATEIDLGNKLRLLA